MDQFPSYVSLNNCEGVCIYVRKCYYDILFNKEGEDKINSKVVLIIEDFGLDQSNKMTNSSFNQKLNEINDIKYKFNTQFIKKETHSTIFRKNLGKRHKTAQNAPSAKNILLKKKGAFSVI